MSQKQEGHRSLEKHESPKSTTLQKVAVAFLVLGIVAAILVALPASWESMFGNKKLERSNFSDIITETKEAGRVAAEGFASIREKVKGFSEERTNEDTTVQQEVSIPTSTKSIVNADVYEYFNFDWGISFQVPSDWTYDAATKTFAVGTSTMLLTRQTGFGLPSTWTATTSSPISSYLYFIDEETNEIYATREVADYTYIFSTTSTTVFSEEAKTIITSLRAL